MILILGGPDDPLAAYVGSRLLVRDVEFFMLDPRLYPRQIDLTWSLESGKMHGDVVWDSGRVRLADVRSVYVRQLQQIDPPGTSGGAPREPRPDTSVAAASLTTLANLFPGLVVNRPAASSSNRSKPYQQELIARHGFRVPRALVTTVPEEARRFYEECRGRVIYKSISYHRSIVRRLTPADLERLDQVRCCPTQFQEYIAGIDIRVHVVGERLFATEIVTEAMDYRYAGEDGLGREMRGIELPEELEERCRRLARGLELALAGIDLRRSPDGEYYCFEVNPSPAFTFYEAVTGQQIGDALIDLLDRGLN